MSWLAGFLSNKKIDNLSFEELKKTITALEQILTVLYLTKLLLEDCHKNSSKRSLVHGLALYSSYTKRITILLARYRLLNSNPTNGTH